MNFSELSSYKRSTESEYFPFIDRVTGNTAIDESGEEIGFYVVGSDSPMAGSAQQEIAKMKSDGVEMSENQRLAIIVAYCTTGYKGAIFEDDEDSVPLDIEDKRHFADLMLSDPSLDILAQLLEAIGKKKVRAISPYSSTDTESSDGSKQPQTKTTKSQSQQGGSSKNTKSSQS